MSIKKYILPGIGLYLLFLFINIPASIVWLLPPLAQSADASGIRGSLWNGSIEQLRIADRQFDQISWQFHPLQLFTGKVALSYQINGSEFKSRGDVSYGFGGLSLENTRLSAPASWLLGHTNLPFRTELTGEITLSVTQGDQGSPWCEAVNGRLLINGLNVVNQFGRYPIGEIAGNLSCDSGNLKLLLSEAENQIGVKGEALLLADNQVQIKGQIRPTDTQPADLKKALTFLGQPNESGAYPINYQGPIPGL